MHKNIITDKYLGDDQTQTMTTVKTLQHNIIISQKLKINVNIYA